MPGDSFGERHAGGDGCFCCLECVVDARFESEPRRGPGGGGVAAAAGHEPATAGCLVQRRVSVAEAMRELEHLLTRRHQARASSAAATPRYEFELSWGASSS